VPEHAPATKVSAVERLGGRVVRVPFERWWQAIEESRFEEEPGLFVHPVQDEAVIAGNGTIGLEIVEELPEVDVVVAPFGGGGLATGVGSAVKALSPHARVLAVEPETAAPFAASLAADSPQEIDYRASFVDGAGGRSVLESMWPRVREIVDRALVVSLEETAAAVRMLAERNRIVAEGAGALAVAAAVRDDHEEKVVCVVSGGNIDSDRLAAILRGEIPG
jgi:threonine dehydratase